MALQGIRTSIAKITYIFVIFSGGRGDPDMQLTTIKVDGKEILARVLPGLYLVSYKSSSRFKIYVFGKQRPTAQNILMLIKRKATPIHQLCGK